MKSGKGSGINVKVFSELQNNLGIFLTLNASNITIIFDSRFQRITKNIDMLGQLVTLGELFIHLNYSIRRKM